MTLSAITPQDVQTIIELAELPERDPDSPSVVNLASIPVEEMEAHRERKARIMAAIEALGDEGRMEVNALMLLGRGDTEVEDFATTKAYSQHSTSDYIAGKAPLADYLKKGLQKLGL